jgi:hypothetical protein
MIIKVMHVIIAGSGGMDQGIGNLIKIFGKMRSWRAGRC